MSNSNDDSPTGTASGDAQAVIDMTLAGSEPTVLAEGQQYAFVVPQGAHVEQVDNDLDVYRDQPRRHVGTTRLVDVDSFLAHVTRHHDDDVAEIYADPDRLTVTAVYNGATFLTPGWGDHRAVLSLARTLAWQAWKSRDGKIAGQLDFAEHLEANLPDIVEPPGADMLEIAQTFQARSKVNFDSSQRLSTGETKLSYSEDVDAKAGRKGDVTIPAEFILGLVPFEGAARYRVTARLRYRVGGGSLAIGYALLRPEEIERTAFNDVLDTIREAVTVPVYLGSPAS